MDRHDGCVEFSNYYYYYEVREDAPISVLFSG